MARVTQTLDDLPPLDEPIQIGVNKPPVLAEGSDCDSASDDDDWVVHNIAQPRRIVTDSVLHKKTSPAQGELWGLFNMLKHDSVAASTTTTQELSGDGADASRTSVTSEDSMSQGSCANQKPIPIVLPIDHGEKQTPTVQNGMMQGYPETERFAGKPVMPTKQLPPAEHASKKLIGIPNSIKPAPQAQPQKAVPSAATETGKESWKFCPYCGNTTAPDWKFCLFCGKQLTRQLPQSQYQ